LRVIKKEWMNNIKGLIAQLSEGQLKQLSLHRIQSTIKELVPKVAKTILKYLPKVIEKDIVRSTLV